jgi:hypothetical protein
MAGEYEPSDSRNVTGQGSGDQGGMASPGMSNQQQGGERWNGDARQQEQQSQSSGGMGGQMGSDRQRSDDSRQHEQYASGQGQMGGMNTQMGDSQASAQENASRYGSQIREHMEVIGADGAHVGTVDHLDGHRIKLTRKDSGMGSHAGHHHYLSCGLIAGVEGDKVRLSTTGANAQGMLEEQ